MLPAPPFQCLEFSPVFIRERISCQKVAAHLAESREVRTHILEQVRDEMFESGLGPLFNFAYALVLPKRRGTATPKIDELTPVAAWRYLN
jgi:hypothetical protein